MDKGKITLVLGASPNEDRYSNLAVKRLRQHGHKVVAIGLREGRIGDVEIIRDHPQLTGVETITLYINPLRQPQYYEYMLSLKPKRIIFNPGTENEELETLASANKIEAIEACTLVMLSTGQY